VGGLLYGAIPSSGHSQLLAYPSEGGVFVGGMGCGHFHVKTQ